MMNNPHTNPFTDQGRKGFNETHRASGLSTTELLSYIGNKSKKPKGPTEDEISQQRLEKLEKSQQ
jgi:hypothetical protein